MSRALDGVWLGRRPYRAVHDLQLELHERRRHQQIGDTVLFVEHDPVITLGRGAKTQNLLASPQALQQHQIEVVNTGRGGDVTLHAPGQLVCYPIVDLNPDRRDVRRYVADLTRCMQELVALYGLSSGVHDAFIGLWADRASPQHWPGQHQALHPVKLGAIGVRISRWVTMHGFALNLSTDMALFQLIVPCGISELGVASLSSLVGRAPSVAEAAQLAWPLIVKRFGGPGSQPRLREAHADLTVEAVLS